MIVALPQAVTRRRRPGHAPTRRWTFITNYAQVLLAVAQMPDVRVREIAAAADITERYAYRVLRDLQKAGYVERRREGRCNLYRIHPELALGDPIVEEHSLWELLRLIDKSEGDEVVATLASARSEVGGLGRLACDAAAEVLKDALGPFKSMNGRSLVVTKDHP